VSVRQKKSWGRIKNDYILAHEQKHFDLTEVFARKLNKELKEYKFNNATVGDDINRIYQGMVNELTYTQQQYDKETDHSRNPPVQQEWNNRIDSLLEVTAPYKNYNRGPLK
jgi:predicted secreted Zn-dependent protease